MDEDSDDDEDELGTSEVNKGKARFRYKTLRSRLSVCPAFALQACRDDTGGCGRCLVSSHDDPLVSRNAPIIVGIRRVTVWENALFCCRKACLELGGG